MHTGHITRINVLLLELHTLDLLRELHTLDLLRNMALYTWHSRICVSATSTVIKLMI